MLDPGTDPASGSRMESWLNLLADAVDGGTSGTVAGLDVGVWRNNAGASVKRKILRGIKVIAGASFQTTATVTFGTPTGGDHDDPTGATAFKAGTTPVVLLTVFQSTGVPIIASVNTFPTNTTLVIRVKSADLATALPGTVSVFWMALGEDT